MLLHPVPKEIVDEFRTGAEQIVEGKPVKIWLAHRAGHRIDTLMSVGTSQAQPQKIFDHGAGFYLLGENVTPDLVSPIHSLFEVFCGKYMKFRKSRPHKMDVRYRSKHHDAFWYNRLFMHYPFSISDKSGDGPI